MAVALAAASTRAAAASAAARASLAAVMSGGASIGAFVVVACNGGAFDTLDTACNGGALDTAFNARTPAPPPPSSSSSSAGEPTSMGARTLLGVLRTLKPTSCRRCSPLAAIAAGSCFEFHPKGIYADVHDGSPRMSQRHRCSTENSGRARRGPEDGGAGLMEAYDHTAWQ